MKKHKGYSLKTYDQDHEDYIRDHKKYRNLAMLPVEEAIEFAEDYVDPVSKKGYLEKPNGHNNINSILRRFLRSSVGKNWDNVYSELVSKFPRQFLDYNLEWVIHKVEKVGKNQYKISHKSWMYTYDYILTKKKGKNLGYFYIDSQNRLKYI